MSLLLKSARRSRKLREAAPMPQETNSLHWQNPQRSSRNTLDVVRLRWRRCSVGTLKICVLRRSAMLALSGRRAQRTSLCPLLFLRCRATGSAADLAFIVKSLGWARSQWPLKQTVGHYMGWAPARGGKQHVEGGWQKNSGVERSDTSRHAPSTSLLSKPQDAKTVGAHGSWRRSTWS